MSAPGSWLSVAHVAGRLSVNAKTVRSLIKNGTLRAIKVGRLLRIDPASLESLLGQGRACQEHAPLQAEAPAPEVLEIPVLAVEPVLIPEPEVLPQAPPKVPGAKRQRRSRTPEEQAHDRLIKETIDRAVNRVRMEYAFQRQRGGA